MLFLVCLGSVIVSTTIVLIRMMLMWGDPAFSQGKEEEKK